MARKGQFKKGGGRVGSGRMSSGGGGGVIVVAPSAAPRRKSPKRRASPVRRKARRSAVARRSGGGGGVTVGKLVGAGIALASAAGSSTGPLGATVYNLVQKVPGAKTFGGAATAGLMAGGLYKFTKFGGRARPWLAAAGVVGVVLAAVKLGEQGTSFKWLGDVYDGDQFEVNG